LFSETWPRSGWIVNGVAYAPQTLERPTYVTASGLLPTPHGMCQEGPRRPGPTGNELGRAVQRRWPTTTRSDGSGGPGSSGRAGGENLRTAAGGSLNPEFVEWMMGFPLGWTEVD
jgi:hypothetical protein